tara:strand:+ start:451 stop:684 length:234 start_codon:yes stop_codon:yes gene_type:complete
MGLFSQSTLRSGRGVLCGGGGARLMALRSVLAGWWRWRGWCPGALGCGGEGNGFAGGGGGACGDASGTAGGKIVAIL